MEHDTGYKRLFSHPEMVADLLRGFVHEPWVERLDLSTLEPVSGSYVSDDLREREDDIVVWKPTGPTFGTCCWTRARSGHRS